MIQRATEGGKIVTDQDGLPIYIESDLTVPESKRAGALPLSSDPEYKPGDQPIFRDAYPKEIVDPDDWASLIRQGAGDHREYVQWIYDQDGRGSCAAEGLCGCVDSQRERRGLPAVKFNPWVTYWFSSGGRDIGSSLTANIRVAKERGLVPMELWPRYGAGAHAWNDVPRDSDPIWKEAAKYKPDEVYDIGNAVEAASALFLGHSVYAAYPGHAWQLIAVLNRTQAAWRNSWGDDWDGDGIGVISFSRITYQYGVFAIQTTVG